MREKLSGLGELVPLFYIDIMLFGQDCFGGKEVEGETVGSWM